MNIQFNFISDLQATQCSWALQGENEYGSSCWPARYCIWVSPPGGESLPAGGAGSRAAWRCLRSPPGSQRALYGCRWGTKTNTNRYFEKKKQKKKHNGGKLFFTIRLLLRGKRGRRWESSQHYRRILVKWAKTTWYITGTVTLLWVVSGELQYIRTLWAVHYCVTSDLNVYIITVKVWSCVKSAVWVYEFK